MTGHRGIFHYQSSSRGPLREVLNQLVEALEIRETAQVLEVFDKIGEMMESGTYNIRHAFYVYNQISDMLFQRGLEDDLYDLINYEELTQLFSNVKEMLSTLQEQCLGIIRSRIHISTAVALCYAYTGLFFLSGICRLGAPGKERKMELYEKVIKRERCYEMCIRDSCVEA